MRKAKEYLALRRESIALCLEASAKGSVSRWPHDFHQIYAGKFNATYNIRLHLTDDLSRATTVSIAQGDLDSAMITFNAMNDVICSDMNCPDLFSLIVTTVTYEMLFDSIEQFCASAAVTEFHLLEISNRIQMVDLMLALRHALIGDRALVIERQYSEMHHIALTANDYLYFSEQAIQATQEPWREALRFASTIKNPEDQIASWKIWMGGVGYWPSTRNMFQYTANAETHRRLALIGIAIRRYTLKHSKLPAELSDLVPEFLAKVPHDPFTDKTFHYEPNKEGKVVLTGSKFPRSAEPTANEEKPTDEVTFSFRYPPVEPFQEEQKADP